MRVTWYSHSCFLVESGPFGLLFDPYFTGNPSAPIQARDVRCTHVFCSHAHVDHLGDAVDLSRANDAPVVTGYELAEHLAAQGVKTIDLMIGGAANLPFGRVKATPALHSCALELEAGKNLPLGVAVGFLVTIDGKRLYHAGDTGLFSDMRLIGRGGLDLAMLPVGDWYTMGIEDAVLALEYLCPAVTLPMHYGTNEKIQTDPHAFAREAAAAGHRVVVLNPGEAFEL